MGHTGGLPTITNPRQGGDLLALQARAQGHAREDGDEVAEHRDRRDHVAGRDVAIVRGAVFTMRGRTGLRHVLHHDVARMEAANQQRALIADHRRKPIAILQRQR